MTDTRRHALWLGLLLATSPLQAQNPPAEGTAGCGPWPATAPMSERIRQVRTCKSVEVDKAMTLADEFSAGSNGLPRNQNQAATWYAEAVRLAMRLPGGSPGARRGEAAVVRLREIHQVFGPGVVPDFERIEREARAAGLVAPIRIRPGRWNFQAVHSENGVALQRSEDTQCLTSDSMETTSVFSMRVHGEAARESKCKISRFVADATQGDMAYACEGYDAEFGEYYTTDLQVKMTFEGDRGSVRILRAEPDIDRKSELSITGRRLGDC